MVFSFITFLVLKQNLKKMLFFFVKPKKDGHIVDRDFGDGNIELCDRSMVNNHIVYGRNGTT